MKILSFSRRLSRAITFGCRPFLFLIAVLLLSATTTRAANANLSALTISPGTLTPAFAPATTSYTESVGISTAISLTPTTADPAATIKVNGTAVVSGATWSSGYLNLGPNTFTIVVTASDGVTTKTYTVTVTNIAPNDALLSSIKLSPASTLALGEDRPNFTYTTTVAPTTSSVTVTAIVQDPAATIKVNGITTASGAASAGIPLAFGANVINIVSTARNGVTKVSYTITATRTPGASLSALTISSGTLSPAFAAAINGYTAGVHITTSTITVAPTAGDATSTIKVNGTAVTSGTASAAIPLAVGANTITIVVTDGASTNTYTITVTRALSSDLLLSSIKLNPASTLTLIGQEWNFADYTTTVAPTTSSVTVTAIEQDTTATITVNGVTTASGKASASIPLAVGSNSINIVSTAQNGAERNYGISATRPPGLSALTISSGLLKPGFAAATPIYTASVTNATTSITLTPTTAGPAETIKVNGTAVTSGTASASIPLTVGANIIAIVVTAPGGVSTTTYTVTVTRIASTDALLSSIKLSPVSILALVTGPSFANYTTTVAPITSSITVTAIEQDATATIKVNGVTTASGAASASIPLAFGTNVINIVSTAQDGVTTRTYTITATRTPGASLSALTISSGALSPAFAAALTSYTASVPIATSTITVTPTAGDATGTIKVDGTAVTSGKASGAIPLAVGANTITIVVTDGASTKTYTITATRALSTDALLSSIKLSPAATLTLVTGPGYANYTTTVPNSTSSVTVKAIEQDLTATIKVNGAATASGAASASIPLAVGSNTINIVSTAQDGVTVKTYTITATRQPNAELSALKISSGLLKPVFAATTTTYIASVTNAVSTIMVTPTAADPAATIKVNGTAVTSGAASASIPLTVGSNTIATVVTGADGVTTKTYTVTVTRLPSSDALLSSIQVSPASTLTLVTGPSFANYTTTLDGTNGVVTVTAIERDLTATLTVNGKATASGKASAGIQLVAGANTINIVSTAQDGTTSRTYTITVTWVPGASLSALQLIDFDGDAIIALSPVFSTSNTSYTATVTLAQNILNVIPVAGDATGTIKVNGTAVTSGGASQSLLMAEGANTITIVVTDGASTKTYTITVTCKPSSNARLRFIELTPASTLTLVPGPGFADYTTTVDGTTSSITIESEEQDMTASFTVNGVPTPSDVTSASIPLALGSNTIRIVSTAQDGTILTYTITAIRPANASLSALKLSSGVLKPAFAAATTSYTAAVPLPATSITLTPTTADPAATVKVNGTAVTSGAASASIPLTAGPNTITTVVTASDGVTTKTYTVIVTPTASSDAYLSSIKLSPASTLNLTGELEGPDTTDNSYTTTVTAATSSVTVTGIEQDPTAIMTVNGVTTASGVASASIPLAVGTNVITITSTSQDGSMVENYIITATRPPGARLSALTISSGTLSPVFATGTTGYTASVVNTVTSVTLTPTSGGATGTITVNGTAVTSGAASGAIPLTVGPNTITTIVTDVGTTKTYTVTVTRAPSADALLSSIKLNPASTLTIVTGPSFANYTTPVPNSTSSVTVTSIEQDLTATMTVNGVTTASGTASAPIPLAVGSNTINIVSTAQDGVTIKTYTITATRAMGAVNNVYEQISVTKPADNVSIENDGITVHQGVSPNGDGINDYLTIDGITNYPDNNLIIVDRNGAMIYQTKGYDNSSRLFDGHSSINGKMQLPGTYFYSLDYTVNGENKHKTGYIILKY